MGVVEQGQQGVLRLLGRTIQALDECSVDESHRPRCSSLLLQQLKTHYHTIAVHCLSDQARASASSPPNPLPSTSPAPVHTDRMCQVHLRQQPNFDFLTHQPPKGSVEQYSPFNSGIGMDFSKLGSGSQIVKCWKLGESRISFSLRCGPMMWLPEVLEEPTLTSLGRCLRMSFEVAIYHLLSPKTVGSKMLSTGSRSFRAEL